MRRIGLAAVETAQLWPNGVIPYELDEKFGKYPYIMGSMMLGV